VSEGNSYCRSLSAKSAECTRGKELRSLADKISEYAQAVHQRYPGDVVVSVRDLAEQFGKRPDAVANALHLLLTELHRSGCAL
jgi:hypothetical protein